MKRTSIVMRLGAALLALAMCAGMTAMAAETFTDVKETDYFYPAVQWGTEAGITNGVGGGRFDPQGIVTRAQIVTFLWRMAGSPEPTAKETFTDVKAGSWYEAAVQWAVENDITNGTGNGQFSPNLTCDRAMCITLLYRMEGSTLDEAAAADPVEITDEASLESITLDDLAVYLIQQMIAVLHSPEVTTDIKEGSYYELAVLWGYMCGIITEENTGSIEENTLIFRPNDPCIRSEMISFLYQTKLMEDAANAPELIENGPVNVAIPQEYYELLYKEINGLNDDEEGILITISEIASRDAAEALGEDPDEVGAGVLFSIGRVSEAEAKQIAEEDIGFGTVFAKDDNGFYYVFYHPTDVRYMRETTEQMTADQDQWTELVEWAYNQAVKDILEYSEGLTPVDLSTSAE